MGYNSYIRMNHPLEITPPKKDPLTAQQITLIEEAKKAGLTVSADETINHFEKVSQIIGSLGKRNETIAWWFELKEDGDSIILDSVGESSSSSTLESCMEDLIAALEAESYSISGVFYRVGEEPADVERFTIADGKISTATAELSFPDGEIYNG